VDLLMASDCPPVLLSSLMVVPERYEMKAGSIGRIHGDKNEPAPAAAETRILASTITKLLTKIRINSFFQITSRFRQER